MFLNLKIEFVLFMSNKIFFYTQEIRSVGSAAALAAPVKGFVITRLLDRHQGENWKYSRIRFLYVGKGVRRYRPDRTTELTC